MKLAKTRHILLVLLLLVISNANAYAQEQKVTVELKNATLKELFSTIEKQTTYRFAYRNVVLDDKRDINISLKKVDVSFVLSSAFASRNLNFNIVSETSIVIFDKKKTSDPTPKEKVNIGGVVLDVHGQPIIGASVSVKGTTYGTFTDVDGRFSLLSVDKQSTLSITYVGYNPKETKIYNQTEIKIILEENQTVLDEVIVVGYGSQSKKLVTTSIGHMKVDDVDQGADYNAVKMLQGRVAGGVNVSSASGKPGSMPNILIRGTSSISGSNGPLYVVDGIPSESMPVINPNDIEQMDILKDASSAAIYGSRANSGVVIITTKSGKSGKTKVDYNGRFGVGYIAHDIKMANVDEYKRVMQTAVDNYNVQMRTNNEFFVPDVIEETDWLKEIYRRPAYQTAHNVSLSGGNEATSFYTSLGYTMQEGAVRKSDYDQYSLRAKFSHKINRMFNVRLNMSGTHSRFSQVEDSDSSLKIIRTAREEQPWYSPYNEDGSYKVNGEDQIIRHNPVMLVNEEDWTVDKTQVVANLGIDFTPFAGFKYAVTGNVYGILDQVKKKISEKHDARKNHADWAALTQQKDFSVRYVVDNMFSYDGEWKDLRYTALVGHSFEQYKYETFGGAKSDNYGDGFPSDGFNSLAASNNIYKGSIGFNQYTLDSYLSRLTLNYKNKYILTGAIRRDGSSRFSKNARYGTFPSASFAWRVSEENFIPKTKVMNELKMRLSWGRTGSQSGIGNYIPHSLVTAGGNSYNNDPGFKISQMAQHLEWEKATQFNVGVDAEFLNSRINFTVDLFYNRTTDLLYGRPTLATTGYTSLTGNIGELDNRGLELAIGGDILTGDFKWNLSGNISFIGNRLRKLLDGQDMIILGSSGVNFGGQKSALINGKAIGSYYMLEMGGIYQYDSDVPAALYAKGVRAGDVRYIDHNKDGDIDDNDRVYVGKANPDFFGGITSTMSWKNFELAVFTQFSAGGKIMPAWRGGGGTEGTDHLGVAVSGNQFYNVSKEMATDYWRGPGTTNSVPRPVMRGVHTGYAGDYNTQTSTRYLENASYFKFKTITLAYNLPTSLMKKIGLSRAKIYASLDNFFTITSYSGYDPEFSYASQPSSANYGVDYGELPTLKNIIFGLNVNF